MEKKLNKDWLVRSLYNYGYSYTDEELQDFSHKLVAQRNSTNTRIKETFGEETFVLQSMYITSKTLFSIVRALEKFYKRYFDDNSFKNLVLNAILQYEKIHCCVLRSEGDNNVFEIAGVTPPSTPIPYQLLIVTKNGLLQHSTYRFSAPVPCRI